MVVCEPDPSPGAEPLGVIGANHVAATFELLDHVVSRGARSVAVLAPGLETSFGEQVRRACSERTDDIRVRDIPLAFRAEQVTRAVTEAMTDAPEALVAVPDGAALVALQHLLASGVKVPDDLLFASYVDGPSLQIVQPTVTAVDIDPRMTGAAAVSALVEIVVEGGRGPVRTEITAHLRVRASTSGAGR